MTFQDTSNEPQLPEFLDNRPMPEGKVKQVIDRHNASVTRRDYEWFAHCGGKTVVTDEMAKPMHGTYLNAIAVLLRLSDPVNLKRNYVFFRDVINRFTPDQFGNLPKPDGC
jgi:hypothetical protein|tara:strand:+ start:234 stop:566 length:333 start_codon:yes stop_codon:yes gene_type:complete